MGEVVVSSEDGGVQLMETKEDVKSEKGREEEETKKKNKKNEAPGSVVRWERFLPRMVLRVLLVEADDSTRQIIAALLRKCSYRVEAVPDGLKAWEVLKGRPQNIDLILTEVELPSISGYPLLTLIMEHEICKNIPVIMMSSEDSISTVYKCMLRGAADFLVKPSSSGRQGPRDESVAQQKAEATAENDAGINHSSGYMPCVQRNNEGIEKGSDSQSSCSKPEMEAESAEMEAESAYVENMQNLSGPNWSLSLARDKEVQKHDHCVQLDQKMPMHVSEAVEAAACKDGNMNGQEDDVEFESHRAGPNVSNEARENNNPLLDSCREAMDLFGSSNNEVKRSYGGSGSDTPVCSLDSPPYLDLSLRRFQYSHADNLASHQRQKLNHSDASAFSRYINRPMQPQDPAPPNLSCHQKEFVVHSGKQMHNRPSTHGPNLSNENCISPMTICQPNQAEMGLQSPKHRVFPIPIPVRGLQFDNLCNGYGHVMPALYYTKSSSQTPSPSSVGQREPALQTNPFHLSNLDTSNSEKHHDPHDHRTNISANQTRHATERKLEPVEDQGRISSATEQSASSSFCNGTVTQLNNVACVSLCRSNGNVDPVQVVRIIAENGNEEGFVIPDGNSRCTSQREAALTKFRLKRKERCYEKKVRYESRKKLAELRPRVKGQFVRQVHTDPPADEMQKFHQNSSGG
ncbi:Signal transduction response regulator, receiver domain [Dillenia turbinata]|uniref:Signal transduction response regulator, receiver domain n=1 Tax=Dillenia turbinata TaxID=194707 RepID=A0AAN8V9P5_9MAGN